MAPTTQVALQRYGPLIMQVIWRLVPHEDDAADIYQETFLQYHRAQTDKREINHPKAWLCRTARNRSFRLLQQPGRLDGAAMTDGETAEAVGTENQTTDFLMNRLRLLVAELPDQQRQAFAMRHFEDLPFAEIAGQLDCSADAARASAHKAMKKLRELLNPKGRRFHAR